jgi:hypothetical protein
MKNSLLLISSLFCSALAIGCAKDSETDTKTSTNPTTNNPSGNEESGSETGASASATDGSASATDGSASDPTMATGSASMTTPGTATEDGTDGGTTAACSFLNCDDMQNVMNECDNWAQDCMDGQKCTAYIAGGGGAWDATKCVDVTGMDKPGDECSSEGAASGIDSCEKGAMCWGVNEEGKGTCVALCTGSPDAGVCGDSGFCTIANDGVLNLCLAGCDPLLQDCVGAGEVCYPIADGFTCAPDVLGEEGQEGDPCEFINVCDKGLMCADTAFAGMGCQAGGTGCCTPFCEFPGGDCPFDDQQCVQYFDPMQFPENDPLLDIGVCGLPG